MNIFKKSLHIWITLASFAGFLAGWAALAQAARQAIKQGVNPDGLQAIMTLPPVHTVDNSLSTLSSNSSTVQTYLINPVTPTPLPQPTPQPQPLLLFFKPKLRTGGS